ncbi:MAG: FAD-binding monooxygenase [Rhodospirillales bacterium]|nr:FAD-binding monooxygenase [Rhodospirillales bacterium]
MAAKFVPRRSHRDEGNIEMARNHSPRHATDVLVVGARTTGLMLAIRLARQGLKVRIVDGSPGIDPHSRATLLHSRSLELLENLGVTETVVASGQALRGMRLFADGQLLNKSEDPPVDSPYPFAIAYSQMEIERLLAGKLQELGVEIERSTELFSLDQDSDGVRAGLRNHDGREELAEAAWLVGCDGAHSTTRHLLGIGFPGTQSRFPYILADVVAENDAPSDAWFYFLHREGFLIFAILDGGRRQIFGNLPEDHPAQGQPSLAEMQDIVDRRSEGSYRLSDPRWLTYFRIHYRLAERFREGRVFLAGDAAHLNSLVGGHGMNTGIQDACNLAWKLALASRGLASAAILDSYEAERRPVAERMIEGSQAFTEPGEAYPRMSAEERDDLIKSFQKSPDDLIAFRRNFEELDLDYGTSPLSYDQGEELPEELRPGMEAKDVAPLLRDGERFDLFHFLGGPTTACCSSPAKPVAATTPVPRPATRSISMSPGSTFILWLQNPAQGLRRMGSRCSSIRKRV